MNNKQLIKVIKTLVEAEVAKKQAQFLSKTFPKILDEEVKKRLAEVKGGVVSVPSTQVPQLTNEVDPFEQAELALQEQRQTPKKQFTKNAVINEVLNNTKPFTKEQRSATPGGGASVLDKFSTIVSGLESDKPTNSHSVITTAQRHTSMNLFVVISQPFDSSKKSTSERLGRICIV